jgi:c-di-GMP-binding flagellar brake protein YcgR
MEKKKWSDIPSLEGLAMEWDYQPEKANGKRAYNRMTKVDLTQLFGPRLIEVKVATTTDTLSGSLRDLCEGGLAVDLATRLEEYQNIKVGLVLGGEKIIVRAQVRHVKQRDHQYTTGLMFIGLEPNARQHIAGIYASKVLRHVM